MRGVQRRRADGRQADIARETQDLRVVRGARDQRRHRVAGLRGDQSGHRPRHLPRAVVPAQAADRGQHARVPRHRRAGTTRRSSASSASRRSRAAASRRQHNAAAPDARPRWSEPHEDRRAADGVDARRGAQPRQRRAPVDAGRARRRASWSRCPSTSASWAARDTRQAGDRRGRATGRSSASWPTARARARRVDRRRHAAAAHATTPSACATPAASSRPTARRVARYDKIHLFRFDNGRERYDEAACSRPAATPVAFDADAACASACRVCYDLRFPELYRALMHAAVRPALRAVGVHLHHRPAHWELLLRARAIENQCYVIAPAQGGTHENGRRTWGHSMVDRPVGRGARGARRGRRRGDRRPRSGADRVGAHAAAGARAPAPAPVRRVGRKRVSASRTSSAAPAATSTGRSALQRRQAEAARRRRRPGSAR